MKNARMFRLVAMSCALAVVAVAALTLAPANAVAGHDDHVEARILLRRGEILPLSRILDVVHRRVPGDVIEVELGRSHHHGWEYEIKVLTAEGRVRKVKVNAGTGVIRKIEDD
jgi:uncharacterized membrane protein YkoI